MAHGFRLEWDLYGKEGKAAKGKERTVDYDGTPYIVKWFFRLTADGGQYAIYNPLF